MGHTTPTPASERKLLFASIHGSHAHAEKINTDRRKLMLRLRDVNYP